MSRMPDLTKPFVQTTIKPRTALWLKLKKLALRDGKDLGQLMIDILEEHCKDIKVK